MEEMPECSSTIPTPKVCGQASYHLSFKPGISGQNKYYQLVNSYNGRKFSSFFAWDVVGTNYYTDMGFVQPINNYDAAKDFFFRLGFKLLSNSFGYNIFPKKGSIVSHVFMLNNSFAWNPDNSFNERNNEFDYNINF